MEYLSYIILGIMLGAIAIIIMKVKKYYYEVSEKELAEKMKMRMYNIQNNIESKQVKHIKNTMKDLDDSTGNAIVAEKPSSLFKPTNIVTQINMTTNTGIFKIHDLFMDIYEEYIKPFIYKTQKMMGQ
jgi:hypothetical protein